MLPVILLVLGAILISWSCTEVTSGSEHINDSLNANTILNYHRHQSTCPLMPTVVQSLAGTEDRGANTGSQ